VLLVIALHLLQQPQQMTAGIHQLRAGLLVGVHGEAIVYVARVAVLLPQRLAARHAVRETQWETR
jgi:hypothetical protein